MSYVPPHVRNPQSNPNPFKKERHPPRRTYEKSSWDLQREQAEYQAEEKRKNARRGLEKTEENFPVLGNGSCVASARWNITDRKFSQLVSEWKNDDDERKEQEEKQKDTVRKEKDVLVLPVFRNTKRFSDLDEKSPKEDEHEKPTPTVDDDWTNVDSRKYRKPKPERTSEDESMNEPKDDAEDDTVWATQEEHETCWDDRRY